MRIASARFALAPPTSLPLRAFIATVVLEKAAIAFAFAGVLMLGGRGLLDDWPRYAALWFVMFAVSEVTEVLRRNQGSAEAAAGILSEAVHFPVSGLIAAAILR